MDDSAVQNSTPKKSSFNIRAIGAFFALVGFIYVLVFLIVLPYLQRSKKSVGDIVQMQFMGNPAAMMTALIGPNGEYLTGTESIAQQDKVNSAYCDVPGAKGTYSSWFTNAGLNYLDNPSAITNAPSFYGSLSSCSTSDQCRTLTHMTCNPTYNASTNPLPTSCPINANCSNQDANGFGVCVATSTDAYSCSIAPNNGPGHCVAIPAGTTTRTCSSANDCHAGQTCSSGTCTGSVTNHVLMNSPWLAEGTVTSLNGDTVNVEWHRVQLLYKYKGPSPDPAKPWWYTNCRFVSLDSVDGSGSQGNANVQVALLGRLDAPSDPLGFNFLAGTDPNNTNTTPNAIFASVSNDFCIGPDSKCTGNTSSAWNLQALGVPKSQLTGIAEYTIQNLPVTIDAVNFFNKNYQLSN